MEKEIEDSISRRFPSLNKSPDAAYVKRSLSRGAGDSSIKRSRLGYT